jgi:hypothetical protein
MEREFKKKGFEAYLDELTILHTGTGDSLEISRNEMYRYGCRRTYPNGTVDSFELN